MAVYEFSSIFRLLPAYHRQGLDEGGKAKALLGMADWQQGEGLYRQAAETYAKVPLIWERRLRRFPYYFVKRSMSPGPLEDVMRYSVGGARIGVEIKKKKLDKASAIRVYRHD